MTGDFRCGVAGNPVANSLTPQLFALVHSHLRLDWTAPERRQADTSFELMPYFVHTPVAPEPELKQLVDSVTDSVESAAVLDAPNEDSFVDPSAVDVVQISDDTLDQPFWFSITSPLKHQIPQGPFNCVRIDDDGIICANTDGWGLVQLACHFGIAVEQGALLELTGGGSAASASAATWLQAGGRVRSLRGRRKLGEELVSAVGTDEQAQLSVDFDMTPCEPSAGDSDAEWQLIPAYSESFQQGDGILDGRWLLVFQHLLAWAALFAPHNTEKLPAAGLLFTRLRKLEVECEKGGIGFV